MSDTSFYVGFAAFVQVAVVFDFGLLFLYQNNRSIFKSLFDHLRKGFPFSWAIAYAKQHVNSIKPAKASEETNLQRGRVQQRINALLSPAKYEYMCDYLAVTGIISGFYSVFWLLFVPWASGCSAHSENYYLTFSLSTVSAEVIAIIQLLCRRNDRPTRARVFLHAVIMYALSCLAGWIIMKSNLAISVTCQFNSLFLCSLAIAYGPVCIYIIHLLIALVFRLYKVLLLVCETLRLKRMIRKNTNK